MLKKLHSLVLDNDINARTRLREVLKNIALKSEVEYVRNIEQVLSRVEAKRFDCLFISSSLGSDALDGAISKVRNSTRGAKLLLIVNLRPADKDSITVASLFLKGSNGFICEPYSAEEIVQLIEDAKKSKEIAGQDQAKLAGSAGLLVRSAMQQIDQLAYDRAVGKEGKGFAGRELERIAESLKEIAPKIGEQYTEILVEAFQEAKVPRDIPAYLRSRNKKKIPLHPGLVLAKLLAERRIAQDRLAALTNLSPEQAARLLGGEGRLDETLAEAIARAVGETKSFWLSRQREYDAYQEKQKKQEQK